ncbi:HD domain-containing protein [Janibacter melonis]|uniref:HD domain-containing protein n=1 Tax=Janibacter melonis TaxID=262209 RepID=A0A5P8FNJ5_9MICO|nr:HD domain-containing phosphohydrolase [Janibacter melonis]QFQ30703.2 HD domain-containing protein [Janibacter melonis]
MTSSVERGTNLYLALLAAASSASVVLAAVTWGLPDRLGAAVPLLLLAFVARAIPNLPIRHVSIQLHSVVLLASVQLVGPAGAMLIHGISTAWVYRRSVSRFAFNASWPVLGVFVGSGLATTVLPGTLSSGSSPASIALGAALLALGLGLTNLLSLAGILRITEGTPVSTIIAGLSPQITPAYLGYGITAYLLVLLWDPVGLGWFAVVLLLPTLVLAQWGLMQYTREHQVYETMLQGLVEALDIRAPGARADAELCARVATAVAEELALSYREVEAVRSSGALHDIGLLSLDRARLLEEQVAARDLDTLVRHPDVAAEMLHGVRPLRSAVPAVLAHHELWDGGGYPYGRSGGDIPLEARIVTVADTWVSLVQPHVGDGLSTAEALRRCAEKSGRSLDPYCVEALTTIAERHPSVLQPTREGGSRPAPVDDDELHLITRSWSVVEQADPEMTRWVAASARKRR